MNKIFGKICGEIFGEIKVFFIYWQTNLIVKLGYNDHGYNKHIMLIT